jgi:hypothetical protein
MSYAQFEYLRVKFYVSKRIWGIITDDSTIEYSTPVEFDETWQENELLSQLGQQGWELAARHDGIAGWILYFKRQICS